MGDCDLMEFPSSTCNKGGNRVLKLVMSRLADRLFPCRQLEAGVGGFDLVSEVIGLFERVVDAFG